MKKFLHAALYITWFQVFVILFFSALKYVLIKYHIEDKIQQPFIWACFGAGIVYVIAWSVIGTIENKGVSYEDWQTKNPKTKKEKVIAVFLSWGLAIPIALALLLFLYYLAPTSWELFVALYAVIVIRNTIHFFSKKQPELDRNLN